MKNNRDDFSSDSHDFALDCINAQIKLFDWINEQKMSPLHCISTFTAMVAMICKQNDIPEEYFEEVLGHMRDLYKGFEDGKK